MFQAILHGKVRDNFADTNANLDWRSRYRQTEDFLTAAVFCRLTYLSPDVLWAIVRSAANITLPFRLPEKVGALSERQFWPRWSLTQTDDSKQIKEPDVFLLFEKLALLVEAKRDDGFGQYPDQWAAEIAAYMEREGFDDSIPIWLLAIGGLGDEPVEITIRDMRELAEHVLHEQYKHDVPLRLCACSWRQLLAALIDWTKENEAGSYVLADLTEVLDFHGFRHCHWLAELGHCREIGGIQDRSLAIWRRVRPR